LCPKVLAANLNLLNTPAGPLFNSITPSGSLSLQRQPNVLINLTPGSSTPVTAPKHPIKGALALLGQVVPRTAWVTGLMQIYPFSKKQLSVVGKPS